jgi:hypothetical protein
MASLGTGSNNSQVSSTKSAASSARDNLPILQKVHIVREYLQRSDDVNIASGCLPALIKVSSIVDKDCHPDQLLYLLGTIAIALEVLRNHDKGPDLFVRGSILDYIDHLDMKKVSPSHPTDFEIPFLLMRLRSALAMCVEQADQGETLGGLIYDTAAILLSQFKYDVSPSWRLSNSRPFNAFPGLINLTWIGISVGKS